MEIRLEVMKDALKKANIITKKGAMTKYAKRRLNMFKNRFGDIALFELWNRDTNQPRHWRHICGLCGLRLGNTTKIQWKAPRNIRIFVCLKCYEHGVEHQNFKGLK